MDLNSSSREWTIAMPPSCHSPSIIHGIVVSSARRISFKMLCSGADTGIDLGARLTSLVTLTSVAPMVFLDGFDRFRLAEKHGLACLVLDFHAAVETVAG